MFCQKCVKPLDEAQIEIKNLKKLKKAKKRAMWNHKFWQISVKYLTSMFIIDFLASFPYLVGVEILSLRVKDVKELQ